MPGKEKCMCGLAYPRPDYTLKLHSALACFTVPWEGLKGLLDGFSEHLVCLVVCLEHHVL